MIMEIVFSVALLFVGIAVLVVIHICIVGRAFRRGYEDRNVAQISSHIGTIKMSDKDLKKLPSFGYKAAEKGSSPVECAVCLENFRKGDKCKLLPNCNHSFHSQCIDSGLLKTPIRPICRTPANPLKVGLILGGEKGHLSSHDIVEPVQRKALLFGTELSSNNSLCSADVRIQAMLFSHFFNELYVAYFYNG